MKPDDVKVSHFLRYHQVIGRPEYIRVIVMCEPWELGDGSWICKVRGVEDDRAYRPSVNALERERWERV
jgi:hypothetical protein